MILNRLAGWPVGAFLAAAALALGCDPSGSGLSSGTSGKSAARKTPTPVPAESPASKTSPGPSTSASASGGPDITSGVDTTFTPAPIQTGDTFVSQPDPTPTPFGAIGLKVGIPGAKGLAIPEGRIWPYFLRQGDIQEVDTEGKPGRTFGTQIGQAVGCAADGIQNVWVLSASAPHVDRLQIGLLGLDAGISFAVPASPVAIGARDQEVWVAAAGGTLTRFRLADSGTASFTGFGSPLALAVGQTSVWVSRSGNELVKVRRTDGATLATYPTGLDPIAVAEAADGSAWTIDKGSNGATRVSSAGATGSIALGGTPSAIVADSRRVWIALPGKLAYFKSDGSKEGEVPVSYMDPIDGATALTGTSLASDAVGRIWVLDASASAALPVWGRKEGE